MWRLLIFQAIWALAAGQTQDIGHCDKDGCLNLRVETQTGPVQGHVVDQVLKVVGFYGIPYAESPVKERRFKPPVPIEPWTEVFQADKEPKRCIQSNSKMGNFQLPEMDSDEDCLKLNVWVPHGLPEDAPVIVYIHGGAFLVGSSLDSLTDGLQLAHQEKVIVVTIAYRLGALGFLYLGTEDVPGNAGLWDQQLALKWVKNNIAAFGGCPDKVTAFGMSAGSASVGLHLLSESSPGLFNRAIMLSGTSVNPFACRDKDIALGVALDTAKRLGFKGQLTDKSAIADFLITVDVDKIADLKLPGSILDLSNFGPTVDGAFIKDDPARLIDNVGDNQVDIILGSTSDESINFLGIDLPQYADQGDALKLDKKEHLEVIKKMSMRNLNDLETELVSHWYINWTTPDCPKMLRDSALASASDSVFNCGIERVASSYSKSGGKVYRYVFDEKLIPVFPSWSRAFHGSEIFLTIAQYQKYNTKPMQDLGFQMKKRLANFARTGDPSISEVSDWPQYGTGKKYLTLKANGNIEGHHYRVRECALWDQLLPQFRT